MNQSRAVIVVENREALRVAAASARISTQQGTALEIFDGSLGDAKDLKLIDKVLSSGHKSVIEHQTFGIAFNDVSVLVEQFVIECRLASFTVKSRRYVDFGHAGYVMPEGLDADLRAAFAEAMSARFNDYQRLMDLGVPKEDARFVLPYCLRSNFFMTLNARELIQLVCAMLDGRGRGFREIESLGAQLKAQFDALYPGVIDRERPRAARYAAPVLPMDIRAGEAKSADAEIVSGPADAEGLLNAALGFTGRLGSDENELRALLKDARPRELELLNYAFRVKRVSLACLTHFARHRIQSPLIPPVLTALAGGDYVLPESVKEMPEAKLVYMRAFAHQAALAQAAVAKGMKPEEVSYFAMSGHQLDILMGMNARELMHFMKLRTCSRAQWEIRAVAKRMLEELRAQYPALFVFYGPSCRYGGCPEGRMSCGHPEPSI